MSSCLGFDLTGFNDCDGWEFWTGYDDQQECTGSLLVCLYYCDDFSSLVGFDDEAEMESMDEDCI